MNFINWLDILLLIILVGFSAFGFIKGFTQKLFSLLSWIGSSLLTFYIYPHLKPFINSMVSDSLMANVLTGTLLFIIFLILFKILTSALSKFVKESALGPLDRGLGLLLGAISGLFLISCVAITMRHFVNPEYYPDAFKNSKVWTFTSFISNFVEKVLPVKSPNHPISKNNSSSSEVLNKKSHSKIAESLASYKTNHNKVSNKSLSLKGYSQSDRQKMNQITENL